MKNNKFPWNCGDCPMLKTYDMSIDDLTHICLWSKKQIDDCDRYKSAECPLEKHDVELLNKVAESITEIYKCNLYCAGEYCDKEQCQNAEDCFYDAIIKIIERMKAGVNQ